VDLERKCRIWDFCSVQISRPYGYKYAREAEKLDSMSIGFRSQTTKAGRDLRSSADPASDAHFSDLRFGALSRSEGPPSSATPQRKEDANQYLFRMRARSCLSPWLGSPRSFSKLFLSVEVRHEMKPRNTFLLKCTNTPWGLCYPHNPIFNSLFLQSKLSNTSTMTKTNPSSIRSPTESKEAASLEIEDPSQTPTISDDRDRYIMMMHGTLELDPLPSSSPRDPLNWPTWKKDVHVLMVAFHAMLTTFTAASIIPGFHSFALKYGTSIEQASYLTSAQVSQTLPWISESFYTSID
jgi:hypothetical protein